MSEAWCDAAVASPFAEAVRRSVCDMGRPRLARPRLTTPDGMRRALERYREAGAGGFIAQAFGPYDVETVERLAAEVWPRLD